MFWYLLSVVLMALGVIFLIMHRKGIGDTYDLLGLISITFGFILLLCVVFASVQARQQVDTYPRHKAFYESITAGSEYEDATFKKTKAELNDELFAVQWYKANMPFFSLYPDEVLELEPIK